MVAYRGQFFGLRLFHFDWDTRIVEVKSMIHQFDVTIEQDSEGYYVASVPALPRCHTQAKSLDTLMERVREAIELCIEVNGEPPEPLDFLGVQRVTIAA
jgi:predicted RNase H-like HicB family nuclease